MNLKLRKKSNAIKKLKSLFRTVKAPPQNQKGVALLITLFAMMMMIFIAMEVSYDSNVEYVVASQQINRLKAYYAAKAGVELSLLRVSMYQRAMAGIEGALGDKAGAMKSMLDPIWQLPFTWPPMAPEGLSLVDQKALKASSKESLMEAQYLITISSEGGRIDINDLGSSIKSLAKATRIQIKKTFEAKIENDEKFAEEYRGFNFDELINDLQDWVDEDGESLNGGDESARYPDTNNEFIPPNQPFKTLQEIHMVRGMTDELFKVISGGFTIFGTKGVNVNYAPKETLMALDETITDEIAGKIIERRTNPDEGGPFSSSEDFFTFATSLGVNTDSVEESKIPILTDPEYNFRIQSTGRFANVTREITVITYDFGTVTEKYIELLDEQAKNKGTEDDQPTGATTPPTPSTGTNPDDKDKAAKKKKPKKKPPEGPPSIVFWDEA